MKLLLLSPNSKRSVFFFSEAPSVSFGLVAHYSVLYNIISSHRVGFLSSEELRMLLNKKGRNSGNS